MHYYSLNTFLREKFGTKVIKLSLDAGFTCPNRDGKISNEGCIFCSPSGSGDFAGKNTLSITQQLSAQKESLSAKWNASKYIAYFQAFTNTYAPVNELRAKYEEAIAFPGVCALAIATRPDCIDEDVITLLKELSQKIYIWVELGLQTSNEATASFINRGYENIVFENAVKQLNHAGIDVVVHVILGLPNETQAHMLDTVKWVTTFKIQGIKLQLLHVLKNTKLEEIFQREPFPILTLEEYSTLILKCLTIIPENIVIHRLTGDGGKADLIAPLWSTNKKKVLNTINSKLTLK